MLILTHHCRQQQQLLRQLWAPRLRRPPAEHTDTLRSHPEGEKEGEEVQKQGEREREKDMYIYFKGIVAWLSNETVA